MASPVPAGKKPPLSESESIPIELIFEILTWLPGKPVARFKCVCKEWLSMIRSAQFRTAYRSRNRGLIMYWCTKIHRVKSNLLGPDRRLRFFYSSLRRLNEPPPAAFSTLLELKLNDYPNGVSQVVNGLICCGDTQLDLTKLTLHNLFTGENMKVPDPERMSVRTQSSYHLGYASVTGDYKILKLVFQHYLPLRAQTIVLRPAGSDSDSTWREMDFKDSGLAELRLGGSYLFEIASLFEARTFPGDGVVCWFKFNEGLTLFDFSIERFWRVKFPDEVKTIKLLGKGKRVFLQAGFNGLRSLALYVLHQNENEKSVCFVLDDYDRDTWRKEDIELPEGVKGGYEGAYAISDGDSMLLLMENMKHNSRLVYGYGDDKSVERFMVGKFPRRVKKTLDLEGRCRSLEHSLNYAFDTRLSCLHDSSVLYRSLHDVLTATSDDL